jgi:hypothetical protein
MTESSSFPAGTRYLSLLFCLASSMATVTARAQDATLLPGAAAPSEEMRRAAREYRERSSGGDAKLFKKHFAIGRKAQKAGNLALAEQQFRLAVHEAEGFPV